MCHRTSRQQYPGKKEKAPPKNFAGQRQTHRCQHKLIGLMYQLSYGFLGHFKPWYCCVAELVWLHAKKFLEINPIDVSNAESDTSKRQLLHVEIILLPETIKH
jgi:hypothetical protein